MYHHINGLPAAPLLASSSLYSLFHAQSPHSFLSRSIRRSDEWSQMRHRPRANQLPEITAGCQSQQVGLSRRAARRRGVSCRTNYFCTELGCATQKSASLSAILLLVFHAPQTAGECGSWNPNSECDGAEELRQTYDTQAGCLSWCEAKNELGCCYAHISNLNCKWMAGSTTTSSRSGSNRQSSMCTQSTSPPPSPPPLPPPPLLPVEALSSVSLITGTSSDSTDSHGHQAQHAMAYHGTAAFTPWTPIQLRCGTAVRHRHARWTLTLSTNARY